MELNNCDAAENLVFRVLVKRVQQIDEALNEPDPPKLTATDLGAIKELRRMIKERRARAQAEAQSGEKRPASQRASHKAPAQNQRERAVEPAFVPLADQPASCKRAS